jgi:UPF0716 protein FxsA
MFRVLFLFFVIVPIIEITVLMQVGQWLGTWPTIAIVILSAWLGAKYVRQQGLATLQSVQAKMAQGEMPSGEIITAVMLLVAGVLLVTPGFVTDLFGLSLLVPAVRSALIKTVQQHMVANQGRQSNTGFYAANKAPGNHSSAADSAEQVEKNEVTSIHQGKTVEGEFERKD